MLRRGGARREVRRRQVPGLAATRSTPLAACRRFGEAELLWHGDSDLRGVDAVVDPGRLLLRRLPALRGDRPLLPGDGGRAGVRTGRRAGARDLQRLPGALRGGPAAGRAARQRGAPLRVPAGRARGRQRLHALHARVRGRETASRSPSSTPPAATTRRRRRSTSSRPTDRCCCATPRATTPTARCATSPPCRNGQKNVMGLMPHPEHAVDPLTGSADGGRLFESLVAHVEELVAA